MRRISSGWRALGTAGTATALGLVVAAGCAKEGANEAAAPTMAVVEAPAARPIPAAAAVDAAAPAVAASDADGGDGGEEWIGAGGYGMAGTGEGGGGTGETIGIGNSAGLVPFLRLKNLSVSGSITRDVASRVLHESFTRLRICMARALETDVKDGGDMLLVLNVDAQGTVGGVGSSAPKGMSDALSMCVSTNVGFVTFPRSSGSSLVTCTVYLGAVPPTPAKANRVP